MMYIYTHMAYMYIYTHMYMCVMYIHDCTYIHTYGIFLYIKIYVHIYIYTHIHIYFKELNTGQLGISQLHLDNYFLQNSSIKCEDFQQLDAKGTLKTCSPLSKMFLIILIKCMPFSSTPCSTGITYFVNFTLGEKRKKMQN